MRNSSQRPATKVAGLWLAVRVNTHRGVTTLARAVAPIRTAIPRSVALGLCILSSIHAQATEGNAIITSRSGSVSALTNSGQRVQAKAHEILQPSGLELSTQQDSQIFITFSNGVALAVDGASSVKCLDYSQRPFEQKDQRVALEPSVSKLRLQLIEGQLAVASNRLSPLSELRIQLPQGEVRLHKGTCLIRLDATGLHITAFEGNLTYYYPDAKAREFISAPKSVRISEQSIERQQIAKASTSESLEDQEIQFCQAAQHASQRVIFQANTVVGQPPVPVLIVSPDYFKQPDIRPYQFKKN